jgi:hypothetical protein
VPSQSKDGKRYTVYASHETSSCTCPDFEERGQKCKHIFAVFYTVERRNSRDGKVTVTERLTVSETVERKRTMPQDWPAYNRAQSVEKDRVQELLFDLTRDVTGPDRPPTRGQRPHTHRDSLFSMVFKVYSTFSGRRFSSDLREAHERGYLSRPIPGMKTAQFFENEAFAPILKQLVAKSALPLKSVETAFAIDSSGFGSSRYDRWLDEKHGLPKRECVWVKCHLACGVKTNVVTAVRVLDKDSADYTEFAPLVKETAAGFVIGEVSADKAYSGLSAFEEVAGFGGTAFIPFRAGTTGAVGGLFEKMFHYFQFKREEYLQHYHRRSNVESTFSMIKRKFGGEVRSRTDAAMVNEVYAKVIAHNLCVLVQEEQELGIAPLFTPTPPTVAVSELAV